MHFYYTAPQLPNCKCQPTVANEQVNTNKMKMNETMPLIFKNFTIQHLSEYPNEATSDGVQLIPFL